MGLLQVAVRPLRRDDIGFLAGLAQDVRVVRHVGDGRPWTRERLERRVDEALAPAAPDGQRDVLWSIAEDDDGAPVALLTLTRRAGAVEVGYWVHPDRWGRGVAGQLLDRADELVAEGWPGAGQVAVVAVGNGASRRVLERAGFVLQPALEEGPTATYRR